VDDHRAHIGDPDACRPARGTHVSPRRVAEDSVQSISKLLRHAISHLEDLPPDQVTAADRRNARDSALQRRQQLGLVAEGYRTSIRGCTYC
jgi:hypothetical protein